MINQITGKVIYTADRYAIIDVSGIGFKVYSPADTLLYFADNLNKIVTIWTYLSVREDALDLYGFREKEELDFFEKIISVSGIGPKRGLGIISIAPVKTLKKAIASKDLSYLTQVSGIGRKNAEKIVLELKDKMTDIEDIEEGSMKEESDIILAIKSLGYSGNDARKVLKDVPSNLKGVSEKIKWALKNLSQ